MTTRDGDPWLEFSPYAPLTIPPGNKSEIAFTIDWALADPGINDEQIIVESNVPGKSPYPDPVFIRAVKSTTDIEVNLVPDTAAVPQGGEIGYWATVNSTAASPLRLEYWTNVTEPSCHVHPGTGEFSGPYYLCLDPYGSDSVHLIHTVPITAPLGTYTCNGLAGMYPTRWGEDHFEFEVTTAVSWPGPEYWETTVEWYFID
jgi:hypothetical protein